MTKKIITFALTFVVALTSAIPAMAYEIDKTKEYTVEDIANIAIEESTEAQNIELNTSLLKIANDEKIKDYIHDRDNKLVYLQSLMEMEWNSLEMQLKNATPEAKQIIINANTFEYLRAKDVYRGTVEMYVGQVKSLEPIILKMQQSEKLQKAELEKLKAAIKKECYDYYMSMKELELVKADYSIIINQLNAENIKKYNGMSTDVQIKELEKQKEQIDASIIDLENAIALKLESLKTKLNITSDGTFDINFKLPEMNVKTYELKDLLEQFSKENLEYETVTDNKRISEEVYRYYSLAYKQNIKESPSDKPTDKEENNLKASEIEVQLATNNIKTTKQNMELYVKNSYFQYTKAAKTLSASIANKTLYMQRDQIADVNLAQGVISKMQYDAEKQDIKRKLFEAEKALIGYENAKNQLELVMQGIWVK